LHRGEGAAPTGDLSLSDPLPGGRPGTDPAAGYSHAKKRDG
jgi:hypothetical protein